MSEELWKTHCATLQAMLMSGAKQLHESEMENARLKAKVERLTKAGIAMGMALPDTDEANAAYRSFERVVKS